MGMTCRLGNVNMKNKIKYSIKGPLLPFFVPFFSCQINHLMQDDYDEDNDESIRPAILRSDSVKDPGTISKKINITKLCWC